MALILLHSERLATVRDTEGNTMRHKNSVFHDLLKHLPWTVFDGLVEAHGADRRVRRLSSHAGRLYHLGAQPVARSTLADANASRPAAVFSGLFAALVARAHRGLRRSLAEATYLIDSTGLRLNGQSRWARFSAKVCGAKAHVIYDADADCPIYAAVTPARINDITAAKDMPIVPGATYVFDLGYYDYRWWAELDAQGCRIVTRFKANTPLQVIQTLALPEGSAILCDRIGFLPARQARSRRNPMNKAVREVRVRTETGKILRILSNDLDASAQQIADLYKRRWAIELFFRWVKQTLKITRFLGASENAVRIQVAVALIAFLLLRLAQATQQVVQSQLAFARLVRANLMHRRRIDQLLEPEPPQPQSTRQLALKWI